uniref:DUF4773 domain-containing protein n=1 Tax=Parastrongyloides trichosuri TaxID=131310 RepID=A0A0N4ZQB1_PARTI
MAIVGNLEISTITNPLTTTDGQQIPFDQCPCFKTSTGYKCIQYDTRYQATSLDEAMITFNDLTLDLYDGAPEVTATEYESECKTADCAKCMDDIKQRLHEIGMIPNTTATIQDYNNNATVTCSRYRFSKDSSSEYKYGEKKEDEDEGENKIKELKNKINEMKKELKEKENEMKCNDSSSEDEDKKSKCKEGKKKRLRRQVSVASTNGSSVSMIGTRFNISCTEKGIDLDGSGVVSLCNKCWSWRRLPSNYYPQYVNELVCDSLNTECLSGFATCSVGTRSIEVYRTDINQTVTLTAGAFCECKVFSNGPLLNLVNGTAQQGQTILNNIIG